jgi:hypothetical protein
MNIQQLHEPAKALTQEIMHQMKQMFSQRGDIMPAGYFLIYDEADNKADEAVIAIPILNLQHCFVSREAKLKLPGFIKHAAFSFSLSMKSSEKIIGVLVINDAFYYEPPPEEKIDVKNALLPQFHPDRKEAIVGMLYFKDSIWCYSYPYLRGETRILFDKVVIEEQAKLKGTMEDLFPHEHAVG